MRNPADLGRYLGGRLRVLRRWGGRGGYLLRSRVLFKKRLGVLEEVFCVASFQSVLGFMID